MLDLAPLKIPFPDLLIWQILAPEICRGLSNDFDILHELSEACIPVSFRWKFPFPLHAQQLISRKNTIFY